MQSGVRPHQIKLIHTLKGALGLDDEIYRSILATYNVTTSKKLSTVKARELIADLEAKAIKAGVWTPKGRDKSRPYTGDRKDRPYTKRPHNMDGSDSRAKQLKKIEALLTVGKKPWGYAHSLAKKICKVDRIEWVEKEGLYKIITALNMQAQREGWPTRRGDPCSRPE